MNIRFGVVLIAKYGYHDHRKDDGPDQVLLLRDHTYAVTYPYDNIIFYRPIGVSEIDLSFANRTLPNDLGVVVADSN